MGTHTQEGLTASGGALPSIVLSTYLEEIFLGRSAVLCLVSPCCFVQCPHHPAFPPAVNRCPQFCKSSTVYVTVHVLLVFDNPVLLGL